MIKLVHDSIVFESFNGKLIEIPAEVLIDFLDCDKLDAILVKQFSNATDMSTWSDRNPIAWQLIIGWTEVLPQQDFIDWFGDEMEEDTRISTLWPKECV